MLQTTRSLVRGGHRAGDSICPSPLIGILLSEGHDLVTPVLMKGWPPPCCVHRGITTGPVRSRHGLAGVVAADGTFPQQQ